MDEIAEGRQVVFERDVDMQQRGFVSTGTGRMREVEEGETIVREGEVGVVMSTSGDNPRVRVNGLVMYPKRDSIRPVEKCPACDGKGVL